MSAFFGEFSRTLQPVDPHVLTEMAAAIPWYGPDGGAQWCSDEVGLGHLLHCITPESRYERQPLVHASGHFVLVANVRLDNRAELIDQLRLTPAADTPTTDPDLILATYAAWGEECPRRLLGDFAFVIWDAAEQKLVCVRDQIGIVPFFYHLSAERFVFAGDIRAILAHPVVPDTLNDTAIAMHLRHAQYAMPEMTFLAGVKKLQPARILIVTRDSVTERVYWTPESAPTVRLPDAKLYAEQMRELLERAVHDRLRSLHRIGAHVSGGLDSSAVAALAVQQLGLSGESLTGYSWLPTLRPGDDVDAPEYVATRKVVAALGIEVENVDLTVESLRAELERDISLDGYTNLWYESLVRAKAKTRGIHVLLSGWGGDEVVSSGAQGYLAELFWRGDWGRMSRWIAARSRNAPNPWRRSLGLLYGQVLRPLLPTWVRSSWPLSARKELSSFSCTEPAFAAAMPKTTTGLTLPRTGGVHAIQARRLTMGHLQARMEVWATQGAQDAIEYRYPLLDRRLVEFCLGVPAELYAAEHYSRPIFRRAVNGLLPDDVRLTTVKQEQFRVERYHEVAEAACTRWLADLAGGQAGKHQLVDPAARYLDLDCIQQGNQSQPAPDTRVGHIIGLVRQVQVLVMTRKRCRTQTSNKMLIPDTATATLR